MNDINNKFEAIAVKKGDTENTNTGIQNKDKICLNAKGNNNSQYNIYNPTINKFDNNDPYNSYINLLNEYNQFKIETQQKLHNNEEEIKKQFESEIKELNKELQNYKSKTTQLIFITNTLKEVNIVVSKLIELDVYVSHACDPFFKNFYECKINNSPSIKELIVYVYLYKEDKIKFKEAVEIINSYSQQYL